MECAGERQPQGRRVPPARPPPPGSAPARVQASAAFLAFQKLHDRAFAAVQKGLNADEEGDWSSAQDHYINSLPLLDETLTADCENLPDASADEKDTAKEMQQKMNKTRMQIAYRLESLRGDDQQGSVFDTDVNLELPGIRLPSYEESVSSSSHSSLVADATLGDSIMTAEYPNLATAQQFTTHGIELFSVADGVQIFHISKEGYVSAPSYPTSMHIVKFQEDTEHEIASNTPPAFLQVGDWFYPLIPGTSPVLHTTFNAYLFPDLSSDATGSSVGLMLPDTMSQEERCLLDDILRSLSAVQNQQVSIQAEDLVEPSAPDEGQLYSEVPSAPLEEQEEVTVPKTVTEVITDEHVPEDQSTSAKISRRITVASKWISLGVGKGAEIAGELISYGSTKLRGKLKPVEETRSVDPRVQKGMVYARTATHVAVSVSSYVVTKIGTASMALARQVAPHIRKKGEKLMPKSMKSEKNQSTLNGIVEVAASGIQGFGTVYMSLEGAAKALARSLAKETVTTVQHKYGAEAGKLTENAVYATGNLAMAAYNVDNLGVKAIAKRAAKNTGKAVIEDIHEKRVAGNRTNGQTNGASVDNCGLDMGKKKDT